MDTKIRKGRSLGKAGEPLVASVLHQDRQSPDFLQCWEAAAINKDGKTGGGGWEKGRGRRKEAVQFSALGLAVESKRRVKMEMWLKGREEGTATRVIRVCVPALMDLLLAVSEC